VKDHPLLFSAPMVRANLEERKTQTRRIFTPQPEELGDGTCRTNGHQGNTDYLMREIAPRYWTKIKVGDRLWVREAWAPLSALTHNDPGTQALADRGFYRADNGTVDGEISRWRPSIHMPRWASRLTLIVTDVRVQRLQDISREDAVAEGLIKVPAPEMAVKMGCDYGFEGDPRYGSPVSAYATLWDHINGPGAWSKNPWVVAYTYEPIIKNIDKLEVAA